MAAPLWQSYFWLENRYNIMKNKTGHYKLKRSLGLFELTLYGIGIILGAGIYALIGVGAGVAGNAVWISFVFAAIIAAFTGLSYAELSSMYPKTAAEYNYTKNAFKKRSLAFVVGWLMTIASIVAAVTVAFGFAGYFTHIFGGSITLVAVALVMVLSMLNYIGIKVSARFNILSTLIETAGLLIVIAVGMLVFSSSGITVDLFETPGNAGITSMLAATAIIFFAYLGFEDIVNASEETKNARKVVPKALVISIIISTILYILVAVSAVNLVGWERLSESKAPLTEAVSSVMPNSDFLFSLIALFATANTSLILLIVGSRILYGMSSDRAMPRAFSIVGRRGTPYFAVAAVAIVSVLITLAGNIKTAATITDISLFVVYIAVNASLIALRYREPGAKRAFRVPLNIGKFPVLALLGLLSAFFMLFYFERDIAAIEAVVIIAGFVAYLILRKSPRATAGQLSAR
ncbi:MAG: amino acid permease [Candidatus Aenigmarchaeota archaeon]|nr:amino acid permease [Candidatus Aenigmarchaeota archaeon]